MKARRSTQGAGRSAESLLHFPSRLDKLKQPRRCEDAICGAPIHRLICPTELRRRYTAAHPNSKGITES